MLDAVLTAPSRSPRPAEWTLHRVTLRPARRSGRGDRPSFEPPTDVYETADRLVVRLEIAGLVPEQLEITLSSDANLLTVAGERPDPAAGNPRKYYTMEIECGEFARQIALPQPIDPEAVSASYRDGFLEIVLPKRAPTQPPRRKVPIE